MKIILAIPLTIILLFLIQPEWAHANSAPVYLPANANGTIIPMEDIPVMVKEEKLQFVLQGDDSSAQATVQYVFQNTSANTIEPFLAFPFDTYYRGEMPKIFVNNREIPETEIKLEGESAQLKRFLEVFQSSAITDIDPITGKPLTHFGEYGEQSKSAAIFKIRFPASQDVTVRLEYNQGSGIDNAPYIHPIYLYQYLLLPASAWKEFHHLQISIVVPKDHYFAANLPFKKYKGDFSDWLLLPKEVSGNKEKWVFFQGKFDSLPKQNLAFSMMSKEDLLFGMVDKGSYDTLGLLILWIVTTAIILLMTVFILRFKKWWMNWLVGPILSFIIACLATFGAYALFVLLVPAAVNGEFIGGYGLIFTFILFIVYNAFIYFPIMLIIIGLRKYFLKRQIRKINNGDLSRP